MRAMTNRSISLNRTSVLAAIGVVVVLTTAAAFTATGAEVTISFERDVQSLLNNNCVFCHMTGAESGNLNLEPGIAYDSLVGVDSRQSDLVRVKPEEPEASYLLHKLEGTHSQVGGSGGQMPLGGMPFNEDQLQVVRQWIMEGALNN